jgi:hypothetical protein
MVPLFAFEKTQFVGLWPPQAALRFWTSRSCAATMYKSSSKDWLAQCVGTLHDDIDLDGRQALPPNPNRMPIGQR